MEKPISNEDILKKLQDLQFWTKKVLTLEEVMQYTGFSKRYIQKLAQLKEIPHSKPTGQTLFFLRDELEKWLMRVPIRTNEEINQIAKAMSQSKNR